MIVAIKNNAQNDGYNYSGTSYYITLDQQGGTGGSTYTYGYYDSYLQDGTIPTKDGYTFEGYYTSTNGGGTQYYNSNMKGIKKWDKKYSYTLYADWEPANGGIELTESNFKNYFNFSSSCSVTRYNYSSSGTASYSFSISPKSSFNYSNSKNPSSITVVIRLDISFSSQSYGNPSEYKITVTLYKSSGYAYSGSRSYSVVAYENYWIDGIYSVDTIIYN